MPEVKSEKQLANEKSERILEGFAAWTSFYRANPHRFAKDYLNINLKKFQAIILYEMNRENYSMYVASRGQGKTYILSIFSVIRCILYPGTKIVISSATRSQGNEVLKKITEDLMKNYSWGSDNLCREITYSSVGANRAIIEFANGSWISVATASDTARGMRANVLICDEFWLIELDTINTVLRRFLTAPRQPGYLSNPKYSNLTERNKEIYAGSAWMKSHWSYDKCKTYFVNMLDDNKKYFVCGLPYQMAIKEGLLMREQIEDEMSEADFDDMKFSIEMGALFYGDNEGSFFSFDDISPNRKLKTAVYPPLFQNNKSLKIPELADDERRILSLDIALMASTRHNNDASALIINSALPTNKNSYRSNIIYIDTYEGLTADELALKTRRLFKQYNCTDLVLDAAGLGLSVFDMLAQDMVDTETGELYPALSCCNNPDMEARCKDPSAPKVIWAIKGSASFNTDIAVQLRSGFQQKKINLLVSEINADEILADKINGYTKMSPFDQMQYRMPYVQTTLLIYELISLKHEIVGGNIRVREKTGMRKDRYSSLAYNYWVQCELERELLRKPKTELTMQDFAKRLNSLNNKPIMY